MVHTFGLLSRCEGKKYVDINQKHGQMNWKNAHRSFYYANPPDPEDILLPVKRTAPGAVSRTHEGDCNSQYGPFDRDMQAMRS